MTDTSVTTYIHPVSYTHLDVYKRQAVSAMTMIAGLETGTAKANDQEGKQYSFDKAQYLMNEFKKENKSVVCQNLLLELEKEPESADGKKRCSKFVKLSAELIEEHLIKNK